MACSRDSLWPRSVGRIVRSPRLPPSRAAEATRNAIRDPARHVAKRLRLAGLLAGAALAAAGVPARAEVYYRGAGAEISGTGPRISRRCTVTLTPAQTTGGDLAPRLTVVTQGESQLAPALAQPARYANPVVVQDNQRKPFAAGDPVGVAQFRMSTVGRAVLSRRLFYVTAQLAESGKFVSSRYEPVDADAILAATAVHCPFDADGLLSDPSRRERDEAALKLSEANLTLLRWGLAIRYGGGKPESRPSLTDADRALLKRYTRDNGLPLSRHLTQETASRLIAEGERERQAEAAREQEREAQRKKAEAERRLQSETRDREDFVRNAVTTSFAITNNTRLPITVKVRNQKNTRFWPAQDRSWILQDGQTLRESLRCRSGEMLCYGAHAPSESLSWGVGPAGDLVCTECCFTCDQGAESEFSLVRDLPFRPWIGVVCNETAGYANVRSGPNTDFALVTSLSHLYPVRVIGRKTSPGGNLWFEIRANVNGSVSAGWIYADFVKWTCD